MSRPLIVEITPTAEVLDFPHPGRARVRRWEGKTAEGVRIDVYVAAVRVDIKDLEKFETALDKQLEELPTPTAAGYLEPLPGGDP